MFHDWDGFSGGFQNFEGLVNAAGAALTFYAVPMAPVRSAASICPPSILD